MKTDHEAAFTRDAFTPGSIAVTVAVFCYIVFVLLAVSGCASTPAPAPVAKKAESSCDDKTETCVVTYADMKAALERAFKQGAQYGYEHGKRAGRSVES